MYDPLNSQVPEHPTDSGRPVSTDHTTPVNVPVDAHATDAHDAGSEYPANSNSLPHETPEYAYRWKYDEYKKSAAQKEKKNKSKGLRIFAASLAAVFVLSFAVFTTVTTARFVMERNDNAQVHDNGEAHLTNTTPGNQKDISGDSSKKDQGAIPSNSLGQVTMSGNPLTIPEIAKKCSPSAVAITAKSNMYGFSATSLGSGFIISEDGYVVTNHHVIENASSITVILSDKTEIEATLIGSDSLSDLAVLKIEHDGLVPMEIGNSDDVIVGESVVAIGAPAGLTFAGSVTDGIVSGINRDIAITDSYGRVQKRMTLIQTNATINKGNSGGPLINSRGQVIGINTLKLNSSDYEGIGFSIPINGAMNIINQLIENGKVSDRSDDFVTGGGTIGITQYANVSKQESEYYGIPQGLMVIQISKDSNAAKAGLRRGDIIIAYNDTDVKTSDDINNLKSKNKAGDEVTLRVYRDGEGELDITFQLDAAE